MIASIEACGLCSIPTYMYVSSAAAGICFGSLPANRYDASRNFATKHARHAMNDPNPSAWPRPSPATLLLSWFVNPHVILNPSRLRSAVSGKTVLITGASFGIGEACARLLGSAGPRASLGGPLRLLRGRVAHA